jgi:hypothetical protein
MNYLLILLRRFFQLALVITFTLHVGLVIEGSETQTSNLPDLTPHAPGASNEFDELISNLESPGSNPQIFAIKKFFKNGSSSQKEQLLVRLGAAHMFNALPLIIDHVNDDNPEIALAALQACEDLNPLTSDQLNQLHLALKSPDLRVQTRTALFLASIEDESSLKLLIDRLGKVTAPESKSTLDFLHDMSGLELGESSYRWLTWIEAQEETADKKIPYLLEGIASKDKSQVVVALKEASILRVHRSMLVSSIVPLLGHPDAKVANMAELCLKVMGGPVAKGALKTWIRQHPPNQESSKGLSEVVTSMERPTIATHFNISSGTQDFLFISGLLFVFCLVFKILGRPTKKALLKIDQATGGHVTRRVVKVKAQGAAALKSTTKFFKRGRADSNRPSPNHEPTPALIRKIPIPEEKNESN